MFRRAVYALACVLALSLPVAAQEQTGSIQGTVRDSSGAVLPGVTVEAMNLTAGSVAATAISDASGSFRFVGLRPGKYDVTGKLQGFTPAQVKAIDLRLGQILTADLALSVGGVTETVSVTAESPIIDTKQGARQTSIKDEQIELLPKGRDFTSLVTQVAGANQEAKLGRPVHRWRQRWREPVHHRRRGDHQSANGSLGQEPDRRLRRRVAGQVERVQAEFGGALGGVISTVTKSGTNAFHGSAGVQWQGDKLDASRAPTLRTNLSNSNVAEYITYPEDSISRIEPGFTLGGPVVKDRLWFFGGYQPALTNTERTVNSSTAQNPSAASSVTEENRTVQYITANVTAQPTNSVRTRLAYNNSWNKIEDLLASLNGLDPAGTNYGKDSEFPNWSVSGDLNWVPSQSFVFGVRGGYRLQDQHDSSVTEAAALPLDDDQQHQLSRRAGPAPAWHQLHRHPHEPQGQQDKFDRAFVHADGTGYFNGAGTHQVKFGVQFDRTGNEVLSGEARPRVTIRWNSALSGARGTYGYYSVRSQAVNNQQGFITEGNIHPTTSACSSRTRGPSATA